MSIPIEHEFPILRSNDESYRFTITVDGQGAYHLNVQGIGNPDESEESYRRVWLTRHPSSFDDYDAAEKEGSHLISKLVKQQFFMVRPHRCFDSVAGVMLIRRELTRPTGDPIESENFFICVAEHGGKYRVHTFAADVRGALFHNEISSFVKHSKTPLIVPFNTSESAYQAAMDIQNDKILKGFDLVQVSDPIRFSNLIEPEILIIQPTRPRLSFADIPQVARSGLIAW
jgi:hypothetical protein